VEKLTKSDVAIVPYAFLKVFFFVFLKSILAVLLKLASTKTF